MNKLNTKKLVQQTTPPHRRTPRRKKIAEVLLEGLTLLWKRAERQADEDILLAKFVPQLAVIQFHIDRILGDGVGYIEQRVEGGQIIVKLRITRYFTYEESVLIYDFQTTYGVKINGLLVIDF